MAGVAVGTMALICILSVMNGFERVISESFTAFDPELRITSSKGTNFSENDSSIVAARNALPHAIWSMQVELDGLLATADAQSPVKVRGVDDRYAMVTGIDSLIWSGTYEPYYDATSIRATVGIGLATRLHCYSDSYTPIYLYAPKTRRVNIARPDANFTRTTLVCNGLFCVQQIIYDDNYIILPIDAVRDAYMLPEHYTTAAEVRLSTHNRPANDKAIKEAKATIKEILGPNFTVSNRYEQQADFFRISRIEKWTSFMILCFIILVATFNIVGSLSMIIIDKTDDISLLTAIGASHSKIMQLFTAEGFLISAVGCAIGTVTGIALVVMQEQFGLLKLGNGGYITDSYPVELQLPDVALVILAVLAMGLGAAYYAARLNIRRE